MAKRNRGPATWTHGARLLLGVLLVGVLAIGCAGGDGAGESIGIGSSAVITGDGECRTSTLQVGPPLRAGYTHGMYIRRVIEAEVDAANPLTAYLPRRLEIVEMAAAVAPSDFWFNLVYTSSAKCRYNYSAAAGTYVATSACPTETPTVATKLELEQIWWAGTPSSSLTAKAVVSPWTDENACTVVSCNPATGISTAPAAAGTICSDSSEVCRQPSTCNGSGTCTQGAVLAAGTSCSNGNPCDGEEKCSTSGTCLAGAPLTPAQYDDGDACTQDSCDPSRGGIVNEPIPGCYAPTSVDPDAGSLPFGDAVESLYTGASPSQVGVASGAIEKARTAVIRGRVFTQNGAAAPAPIGNATVSVLGHPEYGHTLTRADGWYDLAVNGGGPLVVDIQRAGYLTVQRTVQTSWKNYAFADDVILTPPYTAAQQFAVNSASTQVIHGALTPPGWTCQAPCAGCAPICGDGDGAKRVQVYIPKNTYPVNWPTPPANIPVQITEYTTLGGPARMPGLLPPTSGYMYAFDVSLVGAPEPSVEFNKDVVLLMNGSYITSPPFPVGTTVPMGYLDKATGAWKAELSGKNQGRRHHQRQSGSRYRSRAKWRGRRGSKSVRATGYR
jgi:hypothetical protein